MFVHGDDLLIVVKPGEQFDPVMFAKVPENYFGMKLKYDADGSTPSGKGITFLGSM